LADSISYGTYLEYFVDQPKAFFESDKVFEQIYGRPDQDTQLTAVTVAAEKKGISVADINKRWTEFRKKRQSPDYIPSTVTMTDKEFEQIIGGEVKNAEKGASAPTILPERNDYKPLTIVSAFDLNSHDYKKPDYIVEGILYPGLTIFAGPPKYGKSFLSLDLACSIASGSSFLGRPTRKGDVLYLDLEGKEWRTNERLSQLGYSMCPDRLKHTYEADTVDRHLLQQLTEQLESDSELRLLIIDTMARIKGRVRRGEDAYSAEYRFLFPLHDLALKNSIAVVCVTHTKKGDKQADDPMELIIGSQAQYGTADSGWVLTGKREEQTKILHCAGRDYESIDLELTFQNGKWIPQGTVEEMERYRAAAKYDNDPTVRTIIKLVETSGGRWTGTMQELINEVAERTGEYPAIDATRMAGTVRSYMKLLYQRNNIITIVPAKPRTVNGKPRKEYVFKQSGIID